MTFLSCLFGPTIFVAPSEFVVRKRRHVRPNHSDNFCVERSASWRVFGSKWIRRKTKKGSVFDWKERHVELACTLCSR